MPESSSASGRTIYLPAGTREVLTGHGCRWTDVRLNRRCQEEKTGRNPTDIVKQGVKRNLLTNANGLHPSLVVAAANTYDIRRVADTLDALQVGRPGQNSGSAWIKVTRQSG